MRRKGGTARRPAALFGVGLALALVAGAPEPPPSAEAVVSHAEGAPPGHTGGFGEPTCRACHDEYELGVDGRLSVEGLPERYEPGATYTVTLVLQSEGMERAGFQAAFRFASGPRAGRSAGRVAVTSEDVVAGPAENGVVYVGHGASPYSGRPGPRIWSFAWTAPDDGEAPVAFHAAANSANGDNSPFGDIVYAVADTATPALTTPSSPSAG